MIDLKAIAGKQYRVTLDESAEGEPLSERCWLYRIPCKHGFIGVHSADTLMAYCGSNRIIPKLLALPGIEVRQRGDREVNATIPFRILDVVAFTLGARKRRRLSDAHREKLAASSAAYRFVSGSGVTENAPDSHSGEPAG